MIKRKRKEKFPDFKKITGRDSPRQIRQEEAARRIYPSIYNLAKSRTAFNRSASVRVDDVFKDQ